MITLPQTGASPFGWVVPTCLIAATGNSLNGCPNLLHALDLVAVGPAERLWAVTFLNLTMALRGWRQIEVRSFVGYRISDLFQIASYIGLLPSYDESARGLGSDTQLCSGFSKDRVAYGVQAPAR